MLHLRAPAAPQLRIALGTLDLEVGALTSQHGIAATLIEATSSIVADTRVALVENLELFLRAESVAPECALFLNSAGSISDRLINCLAQSSFAPPLIHLPDYDPAGLRDYLRLRQLLGDRVRLFIPEDLEIRFNQFGCRDLLGKKPRNRALLDKLARIAWPCPASDRVFSLIKTTGCGLEQECLLLKPIAQTSE